MQDKRAEKRHRIAILVDAENIGATTWPMVARIFTGLGDGYSLTCFGDFTNPAHAGWLEVCRDAGGTAEMVFNSGNGKNGTDIALTIGAMELVNARAAEMIVIVSDDSDFAPLAHRISAAGIIAIGVGRETARDDLRSAFDRFIALPQTGKVQKPSEAPEGLSHAQVAILAELVERLAGEDPTGTVLLSRLGYVLKKEQPELATELAKGKLRKMLSRFEIATEHGEGTGIRVSPRHRTGMKKSA